MKNNIFLPKKISVGFQKRNDTYTGKLAYIVYKDENGKLRKEKSWETWRDNKIAPKEFDNEPTSGFVLNKKVGGDTWNYNPRQTYTRVYDPRGFEFEITIPNLLYILENCVSNKGKGLEGEFVYGWSGTELLLIPVDAPDYKDFVKHSESLYGNKIGIKDLIPGAIYRFANGETWIYLDRSQYYKDNEYLEGKSQGMHFYFIKVDPEKSFQPIIYDYRSYKSYDIKCCKSLPKIAFCIEESPVDNYAELMDILEKDSRYRNPKDYELRKIPYTFEKFRAEVEKEFKNNRHFWSVSFLNENLSRYSLQRTYQYDHGKKEPESIDELRFYPPNRSYSNYEKLITLQEFFDQVKPIEVKIKRKQKVTK